MENFPFKGLTSEEVAASRKKYGSNILTPPSRDPWWKLFLEKFDDPIIRILMIAAIIAIGIGIFDGKYFEGIGIIIAILLATTLAFANEYKANAEFDILNKVQDKDPIKTLRDGEIKMIAKQDLVVGDIIFLEMGEEIPADSEVLEAISLQVNESRLTGESLPAQKSANVTADAAHKETAYPANVLMRGTTIVEGRATAQIKAVGDRSEIGKTARAAAEETDDETPLNIQLEKLSKVIGVVGFAAAAFLFISLISYEFLTGRIEVNITQLYFLKVLFLSLVITLFPIWMPILQDASELIRGPNKFSQLLDGIGIKKWIIAFVGGLLVFALGIAMGYATGHFPLNPKEWLSLIVAETILKYFMVAVTVIVVAVPEGLAMSVTLSLAYSMRKMIASNVLVRRMHACETIGAATVICTDKTGTLTMNEMRVQQAELPGTTLPFKEKNITSQDILVLENMCANSSAHLGKDSTGKLNYIGNPTEGAILLWLQSQNISYMAYRTQFKVSNQLPFHTERKYMGTLGIGNNGKKILHIKGAPEIVFTLCNSILNKSGKQSISDRQKILKNLEQYQNRGMRTLGFAYREIEKDENTQDLEKLATDLIWLGFVAIADELRPETPEVIGSCRKAGIKVKVVTGDNPLTAREISRKIGLWDDNDKNDMYLTGPEFGALSDEEAGKAAEKVKVLSRARPMDKMRLVRLLKEQSEVVAVTGDGTNDAPALNHANVGLAMGKTGTSVAKEASDIIILDDSFRSIVNGVMWGRSLYLNIQKFVLFQLTINVLAVGIVLIGPFIGIELPLTVVQMLWVNLIMDTFAALALATEPPQASVMNHPPRSPKSFIITPTMAWSIFIPAFIFMGILVTILKMLGISHSDSASQELTIFFTLFVLLQFWNLFNAKAFGRNESALSKITENHSFLLIASCILIGQFLIVQFGGQIFRTTPLDMKTWLILFVSSSIVLWVGEIIRFILRIKERRAMTK